MKKTTLFLSTLLMSSTVFASNEGATNVVTSTLNGSITTGVYGYAGAGGMASQTATGVLASGTYVSPNGSMTANNYNINNTPTSGTQITTTVPQYTNENMITIVSNTTMQASEGHTIVNPSVAGVGSPITFSNSNLPPVNSVVYGIADTTITNYSIPVTTIRFNGNDHD